MCHLSRQNVSLFSSTLRLSISKTFRSSGHFVTGNSDGSVSLFEGSKLMKTKVVAGTKASVIYSNSQIVAAAEDGNLTIMNENLGIIKEFSGTMSTIRSICGNATYLALCDNTGSVLYNKRDLNVEPKVILSNCQCCSKVF